MNTLEILKAARALIADPDRWCQGHLAVTATGKRIGPRAAKAVRWCATGAIRRFTPTRSAYTRLFEAGRQLFPTTQFVSDINDKLGHEAVLAIYDKAIMQERGATNN